LVANQVMPKKTESTPKKTESTEDKNDDLAVSQAVVPNASMEFFEDLLKSFQVQMLDTVLKAVDKKLDGIVTVKPEPSDTTNFQSGPSTTTTSTTAPATVTVPTAPATATADPNELITAQEQKTSVANANRAVVKLDDNATNGQVFKSRFGDYMTTLGINKALQSTRITQVNIDTKKEREVQSKARVEQLRANKTYALRWQEAHTTLKGSLSDENYIYMVINPGKDVSKTEDFFDLWDRVMFKIGDTCEFSVLTAKWTALSKLKFKTGDTVTIFKSKVEGLVNEINTLAGQTNITGAGKGWHFYNGITESEFKGVFEQPIKEVRPKLGNMDWGTLTNKFYEYAPKDDAGKEIPMAADEQPESHAELAMYSGQKNTSVKPYSAKQCEYCHHKGHTVSECRKKHPHLNGNQECRNFARTGICHWQKNTGRPCRFTHANNTGTSSQQALYGQQQPQNKTPVSNETANLVQALAAALVQMKANTGSTTGTRQQQQSQQQSQPPPVQQQGTAAHAGIDLDDIPGILSLVDGLPTGWAGSATAETLDSSADETDSDEPDDDSDTDSTDSSNTEYEAKYDTEEARKIQSEQEEARKITMKATARQSFCGFLMVFFMTMWHRCCISDRRQPSYRVRKKKAQKEKKRQQQEAEAMGVGLGDTSAGGHAVLLDSACSRSVTPKLSWLDHIKSTLVRMWTANGGSSYARKEGTMDIHGLHVKTLAVPDFDKTLISLGDLDQMGVTWTGGNGEWNLFKPDGMYWTNLSRAKDNLYHFTEVEEQLARV
jgi:hypothetical protein